MEDAVPTAATTVDPTTGQVELLPEHPIPATLAWLPLSELRWRTMPPTAQFRESIRRQGVLQPIAVIGPSRAGHYLVAAGRRRCTAVQQIAAADPAFTRRMPCLVFPQGTPRHVAAAMALSENVQRRSNPVTDLSAIEEMIHTGASVRDIADQLNMPITVVQARMRLGNLIPELREALDAELISVANAERVARMGHPAQQRLVRTTGVPITTGMVDEVLRVGRTEQMQTTLPDHVFGGPTRVPAAAEPPRLPLPGRYQQATLIVQPEGNRSRLRFMGAGANFAHVDPLEIHFNELLLQFGGSGPAHPFQLTNLQSTVAAAIASASRARPPIQTVEPTPTGTRGPRLRERAPETDDADLTEAEVQAVRAELAATTTDEDWPRTIRLLELASRVMPHDPNDESEALMAMIDNAIRQARILARPNGG
jgi:hypothetical protein